MRDATFSVSLLGTLCSTFFSFFYRTLTQMLLFAMVLTEANYNFTNVKCRVEFGHTNGMFPDKIR